jgi:phosphoribosyl-ATP pyrophosphohydrolase/phosphoribosyl-AMP cyclohydrolase
VKFDQNGLIPAVIQDASTKEILMVGYMNDETLKRTVESGRAVFWSRSRGETWVKGATSGNYMFVKEIRIDCDEDCLLILAEPAGPACHTGHKTCFYRKIEGGELKDIGEEVNSDDILARLMAVAQDRRKNPQAGSYTNYLFDKGADKILKKVGEEAAEVVIAGKNRDKSEISYEVADLMYHMTVMLADNDMTWNDIFEELEKRR